MLFRRIVNFKGYTFYLQAVERASYPIGAKDFSSDFDHVLRQWRNAAVGGPQKKNLKRPPSTAIYKTFL